MFVRLQMDRSLMASGLGLVLLIAAGQWNAASASTFTTLHTFCNEWQCTDGRQPTGPLVRDGAGNLFGQTEVGGSTNGAACGSGCGVIYELKKSSGKKKWHFSVLYEFCQKDCKFGAAPTGGLIIDVDGNLYGATAAGGKHDRGAIFKFSPRKKKFTTLYSFCAKSGCADGNGPQTTSRPLTYQGASSGVPYDGVSPLYGATLDGGAHANGAVFKLEPHGKKWTYSVLYSFCSLSGCADGAAPTSIFADGSGNLFGTTFLGGNGNNAGTSFKLTGSTLQTLYTFCAQSNCKDGKFPFDPMIMDSAGNLFGTTNQGGNSSAGTLYEIAGGTFSNLYSFCSAGSCADGTAPTAAPFIDGDGNLIGTASGGGGGNGGVIYKFDGSLHVLYSFCLGGFGCTDGDAPHSPLITDPDGNIFGETLGGGSGFGTVFELTP
jgi:uncharacterized repeat protein (TIGR03803 family)